MFGKFPIQEVLIWLFFQLNTKIGQILNVTYFSRSSNTVFWKETFPFVIIWPNMVPIFKRNFHPGRLLETGRLLGILEYFLWSVNTVCSWISQFSLLWWDDEPSIKVSSLTWLSLTWNLYRVLFYGFDFQFHKILYVLIRCHFWKLHWESFSFLFSSLS